MQEEESVVPVECNKRLWEEGGVAHNSTMQWKKKILEMEKE